MFEKFFKNIKENFKKKDPFVEENDELIKEIMSKLIKLNKTNKYTARIILEYLKHALKSDDSIHEFYSKIYLEPYKDKDY
jgi:hypothetical protein